MVLSQNLGFPRIGEKRELKKITEAYWKGKFSLDEFRSETKKIRIGNLIKQKELGIDIIPTFDFALYDHVLATSMLLGVIPKRFRDNLGKDAIEDVMFKIARGHHGEGGETHASELTKWFDTNYHYIVPELDDISHFSLTDLSLFDQTQDALDLGLKTKPVLVGPVTYLYLSKFYSGENTMERKLTLLPSLLDAYEAIFTKLHAMNVPWIQLDEPIFSLDLEPTIIAAITKSFKRLHSKLATLNITRTSGISTQLLATTYFNDLGSHIRTFSNLAADGYHLDLTRMPQKSDVSLIQIISKKSLSTLSLGIINGRNIWRNNLAVSLNRLKMFKAVFNKLIIAPSCSLIHTPITTRNETKLPPELLSSIAFAEEKLSEVTLLTRALNGEDMSAEIDRAEASLTALERNAPSELATKDNVYTPKYLASVHKRMENIKKIGFARKSPFAIRKKTQTEALDLPKFPTTTIGSFPQTPAIRKQRNQFKKNLIDEATYEKFIKLEIKSVIEKQETIGLDVLVHGEAERNDMVEYFADKLTGYAFSQNGWVQSYGSRYVKPPIIYGDVERKHPMTVKWSTYAQSLTQKHVKGMLTGPITMLQWSFVREDQPRSQTAFQLALAIQDEVQDLEAAGIQIIQIDEPAIREGLPLRKSEWKKYLDWAVKAFKLCSVRVSDRTQIQTHMCYSYFSDIIDAIVSLDADVILIESSRSKMGLLKTLTDFDYPADIGPGVYDIHSPRVPPSDEMYDLLKKALEVIVPERLWVNPDCGLKTREWTETEQSLKNLVASAHALRKNA
ncbi:5-methyltetrahydropteroyltriglutamate--homocysteine methyltransferase [Spirochaetota bacterium]|nr:5-methyltetrahydropteroyltriglutamate--homocysteine methyltransferase [Spirochaetota bacterium]